MDISTRRPDPTEQPTSSRENHLATRREAYSEEASQDQERRHETTSDATGQSTSPQQNQDQEESNETRDEGGGDGLHVQTSHGGRQIGTVHTMVTSGTDTSRQTNDSDFSSLIHRGETLPTSISSSDPPPSSLSQQLILRSNEEGSATATRRSAPAPVPTASSTQPCTNKQLEPVRVAFRDHCNGVLDRGDSGQIPRLLYGVEYKPTPVLSRHGYGCYIFHITCNNREDKKRAKVLEDVDLGIFEPLLVWSLYVTLESIPWLTYIQGSQSEGDNQAEDQMPLQMGISDRASL